MCDGIDLTPPGMRRWILLTLWFGDESKLLILWIESKCSVNPPSPHPEHLALQPLQFLLATETWPFLSMFPFCTPLGRCYLSVHFFHTWNLSCRAMGFKIVLYLEQEGETLVRMKMPRPQLRLPSKEFWVGLILCALERAHEMPKNCIMR